MAFSDNRGLSDITPPVGAGADLRTHQYKAVRLGSGGVVLTAAVQVNSGPVFILQNKPNSGDHCELATTGQIAKAIAGAAIPLGARDHALRQPLLGGERGKGADVHDFAKGAVREPDQTRRASDLVGDLDGVERFVAIYLVAADHDPSAFDPQRHRVRPGRPAVEVLALQGRHQKEMSKSKKSAAS